MSDNDTNPVEKREEPSLTEGSADTAQLIYILYMSSILLGLTALIGVIWAYVSKSEAPEWLQTHYTFLIHTFWKGLLYGFIGMILSVILIGFLVLLFTAVWWIVRCVKGLQALNKKEPIENPTGWMF